MGQELLSPWDAQPYFFTPTARQVTVQATATQLCDANPMRVALLMGTNAGLGAIGVSISKGLSLLGSMPVNQTNGVLGITQREFGPLCQQEWWGIATAPNPITVIEILLNSWPKESE